MRQEQLRESLSISASHTKINMSTESHKVVTRFAPSPTGWMHVGGVRTALYAWLWARKNHGTFILRIEDTDKDREVEGSIDHIMESLMWLGIHWDQGPNTGGPHEPYIQSLRLDIYKKYAHILIDKGYAYPDPYTESELESFRNKADEEKRPFLFRDHRPTNIGVWDGTQPLRFKTPVKKYIWNDLTRGELTAGEEALDDFILIKKDGYPTYNFAHIIDDLEMGVTHIMRADEFISSTPKFLAVYEALGIKRPELVTLPPILATGGKKKLGKRDGAKDILEYRNEGYLPSAMMNFLALLGWNPGNDKEIFTPDELISEFDISRIQKSGAQLDEQKLIWINREHMKQMDFADQKDWIMRYLPENIFSHPLCTEERIHALVPILMERIEKFSDIRKLADEGELDFFFNAPKLNNLLLSYKGIENSETKMHLEKISGVLVNLEDSKWTIEKIKEGIMLYTDTLEKRGPALHPLRYALSGREKSPDPFTIAEIIGKNETLQRINNAILGL